ncbi:MAG: hypothetical protein PHN19_01010 [Patescibacteria group bacterium]|nr:hypothetical protein [Patescibacteria group bacterium]
MNKYLVKICEYGFLLSLILFILLTVFNSWTDYVINERYLNSQIILVLCLIFGIILAFVSDNSKYIKNKNE